MTGMRLLRIAVAATLVAVVSGVPRVASALLVGDCCGERCDGDVDGRGCPPGCPSPSCAKSSPSAVTHAVSTGVLVADRAQRRPSPFEAPTLPLVSSGVFHPPRR